MTSNKKPPELDEDAVDNERVKYVMRKIKEVSNGFVYMYQWNVGAVKNPPLCLYIDPEHIKTATDAVGGYGGKRSEGKDGAIQFDMADACGVPGNHVVFYKTGKMIVTSTDKGKGQTPPKFDFFKTVLIDVVDDISKAIKGFVQTK